MGVTAEMSFTFAREKHARWAMHIVEGIMKVALAKETSLDEELGLSRYSSLMAAYFFHDEELKDYSAEMFLANNALTWTQRRGTRIVVSRCADIQGTFPLRLYALEDEPFPQICLALTLRFPQVRFAAYCRHEQTTSGSVQLTRAAWDGERLRLRQLAGDLPFDERTWDTWDMLDLRFCDGEIISCDEAVSPLEHHYRELLSEAREASDAGDTAGVLYFSDAAEALPGCKDRVDAALQRGLALEHVQRCGIRRIMPLWSSQVPDELAVELDAASPVSQTPLGGGRFELQAQEAGFIIVDTHGGAVIAEQRDVWGDEPTYVVRDFLVRSGSRTFLIDWEYVEQTPLENMW